METIRYFKPDELKAMTANRKQEFSALFQKLKKKKPKNLDDVVHRLHREAFEQFDCLDCANCCSTISPIVTDKDAERLAKSQKMKPADFIGRYLYVDEDHDYVFQQTPCPFLMADNYCCVYENRPRACREYPHTDRNRFYQILNLTQKNCEVCPIVFSITSELTKMEW
ncbi:YkgJ family cysteine cluster protein [Gaoshiqia sediminis]|uniref:YkgJ family cysteine cluster protein n=1 Tax=Gaoshiqia sediminis TaxID=2986998 RepID=A0AA41Y8B9_9BACT|nr:YkgJ family cysteine cluster protein [Gaoshiqia sediminis]MCW0483416.1 YkgJ family cysteine cluster protein [Gaoshiqia sediminis]